MTFGTATCGRPDEMTSATALPIVTCVPAAGDSLITEPAGTVVLEAVVMAPTARFAPVIAVAAAACVRPTTFGTPTGAVAGAARISTAVMFHRSLEGPMLSTTVGVPALAIAAARDCTQNVWF